jgi:ubiquinone/menaquinone biosynthesis C-methylase UbiE
VQEGYERWAHIYDKTPNPVLALEERHLNEILPDLAGKDVLDLACGTGRWIPRLVSRRARQVIGIDLSAAMLQVARAKCSTGVGLVLGDWTQLPFHPTRFDFALCSFALNHIRNLDVAAGELARALKAPGRLLVTEMHPEAYARGWRTGFRDEHGAAQIETVGRSSEMVIASFCANGFAAVNERDLFFSELELPIFREACKTALFEDACRLPAVKVYEFRNETSQIE